MMLCLSRSVLLLLLVGTLLDMAGAESIRDVCVVGGGPSGTYAALLLEQKGYDVVLFEQGRAIGGKTIPPSDGTQEVLRHLLVPDAMPLAAELQAEFDIPSFPPKPNAFYYTSTGSIIPRSAIPPPSNEVTAAIALWVSILTTTSVGQEALSVGHVTDSLVELQQPSASWLASKQLTPLIPIIYLVGTNFGYDFLNDVPALYLVTYIGQLLLKALTRDWLDFPYHTLLQKMAADLKDVRLGAKVQKVVLGQSTNRVYTQGKAKPTFCKQVMLAFPQTSATLSIVRNLQRQTEELFKQVQVVYYYEVLISDLPNAMFPTNGSYNRLFDPSTMNATLPNVYLRATEGGKVVTLLNSADVKRTKEEVFSIIREHVALLYDGYDHPVESMELYAEHLYLPHVKSESLQNGFYQKLDEAQGQQGLFYLGGLLDFELVEKCLQTTAVIIDEHFS